MLEDLMRLASDKPKKYSKVMKSLGICLSFKEHMMLLRSLSKKFKEFVENKVGTMCPDRLIYYNMKPGFVFPLRNNKIIQLTNKVHIYLWHYYPDYNQWLFNYILNKEIYFVMDELNRHRIVYAYNMFKFKKLKYCKIMNMNISGLYLNGLVACAERVCFKNVVF